MSTPSDTEIRSAIEGWIDPFTRIDPVSSGALKSIEVNGASVLVTIRAGYPVKSCKDRLVAELEQTVLKIPGVGEVTVEIDSAIVSHSVQPKLQPFAGIKNILAVASGKGGVGKSTTAVNLALALSAEGARCGILDADIYGPSQPLMLGLSGPPQSLDGKTMEPREAYGIQSNSIGYLIDEDTPMIWRGPMVTNALQQLLSNTNWKNLDYLIVDMPPGTGDIQLTLSQQVPVSGAVIITTPQDISLLDAQKGLKMFEKVDVPVLGIIENMSTHICGQCGHEEAIFGHGGGQMMAEKYGVELLGSLPLDIAIRENADSGHPSVIADPEGSIASRYRDTARTMAARLSLQPEDHRGKFPKIVVKNG